MPYGPHHLAVTKAAAGRGNITAAGTCTWSCSSCKCPGTALNLSARHETHHQASNWDKCCSIITPLSCQENQCCHQKMTVTLQANISAKKASSSSSLCHGQLPCDSGEMWSLEGERNCFIDIAKPLWQLIHA